ncbi:MAG: alpha-L-fucosidase [Fimbriimonas sp.]
MRAKVIALLLLLTSLASAQLPKETKADHDKRMKWWREARFGMFIHWGLYAVPGGVWKGKEVPNIGEWIMNSAQIKVADYEPLQQQFNPVDFDAREWVRLAKGAGMKYIVITSKHHDGFGLFDSKQTTWDIMGTPYKKDILKQLAAACKAEGIRLCFYHSIMDWHHPDYLPRRDWDPRPEWTPNFQNYVTYMKAQLKELLTNYGDIGVLWFDGEWEATWTPELGKDLYQYVRKLKPNILINNRVDKGRQGMAGMTVGDHAGDFGTPEQEIPAGGIPGVDWESCMTMNDTWGFKKNDHNWKSARQLIENLIDCASKGGNYLLNVGPTPEGRIPDPSIERLKAIGDWTKVNGQAIYGTSASPFPKPLPWGRVTSKPGKLFLHVFAAAKARIVLPGLTANISRVYRLGDPKKTPIAVSSDSDSVTLQLTGISRDWPTVYVLEYKGELSVKPVLLQQDATGGVLLSSLEARVVGATAKYEPHIDAIGFWTNKGDVVEWEFEVKKAVRTRVTMVYACDPKYYGSTFEIRLGNQVLTGDIDSTGDWSNFIQLSFGNLDLKPGKNVLRLVPTSMPNGAVMNLKNLLLEPVAVKN